MYAERKVSYKGGIISLLAFSSTLARPAPLTKTCRTGRYPALNILTFPLSLIKHVSQVNDFFPLLEIFFF